MHSTWRKENRRGLWLHPLITSIKFLVSREDSNILAIRSNLEAVLSTSKGDSGAIFVIFLVVFYVRMLWHYTIIQFTIQKMVLRLSVSGMRGVWWKYWSIHTYIYLFDGKENNEFVRMMSDSCRGTQSLFTVSECCERT